MLYRMTSVFSLLLFGASLVASKKLKMGDVYEVCHVADIALVIDSSRSIYPPDFQDGLKFLGSFTEQFIVGPDNVRVAAVSFGERVFTEDAFGFDSYLSNEELSQKIQSLPFRAGGRTQTGQAIRFMRENLMKEARPGVKRIGIVLTDGRSSNNPETIRESEKTRAAGITIFAIGVGRGVDPAELLQIGGSEKYAFQVNNYSQLHGIIDELGETTCRVTTPEPPTTTPPPKDEPCGVKYPADVNFVFDSEYLGANGMEGITKFVDTVVSSEDMKEGMQVGCVTAKCQYVEGFSLNKYSDPVSVHEHLDYYVQPHLSSLVQDLNENGYSEENGGRPNARRIAVIFVGGKIPIEEVKSQVNAAKSNDVEVYVVNMGGVDSETLAELSSQPATKYVLNGAPMVDLARTLVNRLCKKAESNA